MPISLTLVFWFLFPFYFFFLIGLGIEQETSDPNEVGPTVSEPNLEILSRLPCLLPTSFTSDILWFCLHDSSETSPTQFFATRFPNYPYPLLSLSSSSSLSSPLSNSSQTQNFSQTQPALLFTFQNPTLQFLQTPESLRTRTISLSQWRWGP